MGNGREGNGRFAPGNPGGPGRPPRAVERDYLAALADAVSVEEWRAIVARAKADALDGDPKARAWLAGYLLGNQPLSLLKLAGREAAGIDTAADVAHAGDEAAYQLRFDSIMRVV